MPQVFGSTTVFESTYKQVEITDDTSGTSADVWDPAAGKRLRLSAVIISANGSGKVQIRDKTANEDIVVVILLDKQVGPFSFGDRFCLTPDHILEAKWTADATGKKAYVTAIGSEL